MKLIHEGSQFNQILCAFLISIPMFCYGNTIGWMSPMTLLLQSDKSPKGVPLTDFEAGLYYLVVYVHLYTLVVVPYKISWMASLPYLVCVPATYLMAAIGDRYGRKLGILLMSGICVAVWLLKLFSMNIWVLIFARIMAGIIMAGSCVTCPTYIKEISEDKIRGALGCWGALFFTTGSLCAYVIGDICSYRVVLIVFMVIPAVHSMIFLMMPESPSYLIKREKYEEASKSLMWLRCRSECDLTITNEIDCIKKEQKNDESQGKFLIKNILTDKILRKAFQISLIAALSRELCGAVPVLNFAGDIFELASKQTGLKLSPNQQAIVLGVVQLCGATLASGIVERFGRRSLLFVTSIVSGLSMCLLATWFLLHYLNLPAWIPVLSLCLCIFCDASGLMPIAVVIAGETFSFKYRGTVLATTMAIASIADFIQILFFKPLIKAVGVHVAFYFFGAMCLLTALYVILAVPETKNRKLEDIYEDLRTKKDKKVTKEQNAI